MRRSEPMILLVAVLLGSLVWAPVTRAALSGPVAQWAFDEASGSTILDSSGNGRNGSFSGHVTRIDDGSYGRALRLASGGTTIGAPGSGLRSDEITVSMWVRSASKPATGTVLMEKGARGCEGPSYGLYVYQNGLQARWMESHGNVNGREVTTDLGLWDGQWHHVSFTYGSLGGPAIFVDGSVWGIGTGSGPISEVNLTTPDFSFGSSAGGSSCGVPSYVGDLDDIRIYDRPLDGEELGSLEHPVATTTTVSPIANARAYVFDCYYVTVSPAPAIGSVRLYERPASGPDIDLGVGSNTPCI